MTWAAHLLALLLGLAAGDAAAQLRYLGQQIVQTGTRFQDTEIGGLSGLDFDPRTGSYYAISDDRSRDARFYLLALDLSKFNRALGPGMAGVQFTAVHLLLDGEGRRFEGRSVDPEAIRLHPTTRSLVWSSEGDPRKDIAPFVREMNADGTPVRSFRVPQQFLLESGKAAGVRNNLAFESVAITPSGARVLAATENALAQDGPVASRRTTSDCRVVAFDYTTADVLGQYVYRVDPVVAPSIVPNGLETNGLADLIAVEEDLFIAVERSFSAGSRLSIRLYLTHTAGATEVSDLDSLRGAAFTPMPKRLLLDLSTLTNDDGSALWLDNIEAVSFGPVLPNGNPTLVLVSDNNFKASQQTQFLAFEVTQPLH